MRYLEKWRPFLGLRSMEAFGGRTVGDRWTLVWSARGARGWKWPTADDGPEGGKGRPWLE